jgi:hypothetical protein
LRRGSRNLTKRLRKSSVVADTWTAKQLWISLREPRADYSFTETEEEFR